MKKQTKLGLVLAAAAVISVSVASLVSAKGWVQNGADWYYVDNSGEYVTETIQSSGNAKFYLGEDGAMQRDFFLEDYNNNAYYFGQNGAMVTNTWVAIESSRVENQEDYVPDNYWYYFQASGKAMRGTSSGEKKTTIDGKKYAFNQYGQMLTGWIADGKVVGEDEDNPFKNAKYYAGGDNDGVLRSGWLTYYDGYDSDDGFASEYTNLYFYFNTSNNEKYGLKGAETKKINGKTYAFSEEGIMMSGWDPWQEGVSGSAEKATYFSTEDDGHQVKKGWVYAVPSSSIDSGAHDDDEEKYMYFNASGEIVKDQFKKINGKYYVFDGKGIMKTGVIVWAPNADKKYLKKLDLDYATGEELSKKGYLRYGSGEKDYYAVDADGQIVAGDNVGTSVKLHLFGSDGARKTGANNVDFSDDTFVLTTNASGDRGSGVFSKRYYSLGIQLKANADIRYGIYNNKATSSDKSGALQKQTEDIWNANLQDGSYNVLNTSGTLVKGNNAAKKDADGNFWKIKKGGDTLEGIWTVNVKSNASFGSFKTRAIKLGDDSDGTKFDEDETYTLGQIEGTISETDLAVWYDKDVIDANDTAEWTWKVLYDNGYYLQLATAEGDNWGYQSDIADKSNAWIPFGFLDNSKKTVGLYGEGDYIVTPNDDYFLNCYWN